MGDDLKNLGIYVSQVIFLALKPPPPHLALELGQIDNEGTPGAIPRVSQMK